MVPNVITRNGTDHDRDTGGPHEVALAEGLLVPERHNGEPNGHAEAETAPEVIDRFRLDAPHRDGKPTLAVFSFEPAQAVPLELRAFAPATGVPEDPVTGSAQAAVGEWLSTQGRLAALGGRYLASQGHAVGRAGEVRVSSPGSGRVHIGGRCCALIRGAVDL